MSDAQRLDVHDRPPAIQRLATTFSWILVVLISLLFLSFFWRHIASALDPFFNDVKPEQIRDLTLLGYFASWAVAMYVDLRIQASVYQQDPSRGRLVAQVLGVALALFIFAFILIWSRTSGLKTALALNIFFLVNVLAWLQTVQLTRPLIDISRNSSQQRPDSDSRLAQLDIVSAYITGRWQWWRFSVMLLIICAVDLLSFSPIARGSVATFLHHALPGVPTERINALLPDIAILLFVIAAEAWSWVQRVTTAVGIWKRNARIMMADHPRLGEFMSQFFDQQFKTANHLMIAHAAALVTTLTLVKDYVGFS